MSGANGVPLPAANATPAEINAFYRQPGPTPQGTGPASINAISQLPWLQGVLQPPVSPSGQPAAASPISSLANLPPNNPLAQRIAAGQSLLAQLAGK